MEFATRLGQDPIRSQFQYLRLGDWVTVGPVPPFASKRGFETLEPFGPVLLQLETEPWRLRPNSMCTPRRHVTDPPKAASNSLRGKQLAFVPGCARLVEDGGGW